MSALNVIASPLKDMMIRFKHYLGNEMIFVRLYIYTPSSRDIDEVLDERMALIPRNLRYNRSSEALICVNNYLAVITYGNGYRLVQ